MKFKCYGGGKVVEVVAETFLVAKKAAGKLLGVKTYNVTVVAA